MVTPRSALRARLLAARAAFSNDPERYEPSAASLARWLRQTVAELEPDVLGLYWPRRSEFNAAAVFAADTSASRAGFRLALPRSRRAPPRLDYHLWDGVAPAAVDELGIPVSDGPAAVPDVVLVPCVGYTAAGDRLGYGGGYFDRWLAAHPGTTAVGVAWSLGRLDATDFAAEPHDVPLALIVTEHGVA